MGRKVYNQEFKSEAVELANRKGLKKAAEDLGVNSATLRRWQSEVKNPKHKTLEEAESELARVKKENEYLKKINEVLKKSHGIFAKDHLTNSKS
jgi:transposase-like protein